MFESEQHDERFDFSSAFWLLQGDDVLFKNFPPENLICCLARQNHTTRLAWCKHWTFNWITCVFPLAVFHPHLYRPDLQVPFVSLQSPISLLAQSDMDSPLASITANPPLPGAKLPHLQSSASQQKVMGIFIKPNILGGLVDIIRYHSSYSLGWIHAQAHSSRDNHHITPGEGHPHRHGRSGRSRDRRQPPHHTSSLPAHHSSSSSNAGEGSLPLPITPNLMDSNAGAGPIMLVYFYNHDQGNCCNTSNK